MTSERSRIKSFISLIHIPSHSSTNNFIFQNTLTINQPNRAKYTLKPSLTCFDMHFVVINPVFKRGLDFSVCTWVCRAAACCLMRSYGSDSHQGEMGRWPFPVCCRREEERERRMILNYIRNDNKKTVIISHVLFVVCRYIKKKRYVCTITLSYCLKLDKRLHLCLVWYEIWFKV